MTSAWFEEETIFPRIFFPSRCKYEQNNLEQWLNEKSEEKNNVECNLHKIREIISVIFYVIWKTRLKPK